jgi:hypothetical protein
LTQRHGIQAIVVSDVRYENEVMEIRKMGGKIIRLMRAPLEDGHLSENNLNGYTDWDLVIPGEATEDEACALALLHVKQWLGE